MTILNALWDLITSALIGSDVNHIFCQLVTLTFFSSLAWLLIICRRRAFDTKSLQDSLPEETEPCAPEELVALLDQTEERWQMLQNFTDSLVETRGSDGNLAYHRTQPAANQINPEAFNPSLFKGYFLIWIPSVLTTLGVLGTFVGLQIGLGGISLSGTVDEMLSGIRVLIEGAQTAFTTSIFGVSAGILYGVSLRVARQRQRNQMQELANRLDALLPEGSPEDDLRQLRDSASQTTDQLKALREEVGPRLQETLQSMPTLIGSAVAKEIQGAVGAIGQQNAEDLGAALKEVYSEHLGDLAGLGETIRTQSELTNEILAKLETLTPALETSAGHLDSSSKSLEAVSTSFGSWDEKLESYSTTLSGSTEAFTNASATLGNAATLIEGAIPQLQQAIGNATEATAANQTAISENSQNLLDSFGEITGSLNGIGEAAEALGTIAPSLDSSATKLNELMESLEASSTAQSENATKNQAAAEKFEEVSGHFENAATHLAELGEVSSNLTNAGSAAQEGFTKLGEVTTQLQGLGESLKSIAASFDLVRDEELGENFASASQNLKDASDKLEHLTNAGENLENAGNQAVRLFRESGAEHTVFIEGLTTSVGALKTVIEELILSYRDQMAEQTTQRIADWNEAATNFGIQFTQKIDDLSGSIEDLQDSLENLNE